MQEFLTEKLAEHQPCYIESVDTSCFLLFVLAFSWLGPSFCLCVLPLSIPQFTWVLAIWEDIVPHNIMCIFPATTAWYVGYALQYLMSCVLRLILWTLHTSNRSDCAHVGRFCTERKPMSQIEQKKRANVVSLQIPHRILWNGSSSESSHNHQLTTLCSPHIKAKPLSLYSPILSHSHLNKNPTPIGTGTYIALLFSAIYFILSSFVLT